ncbi:mannose-1-phosphate guanylyltransferase [Candidatus Falkowbacteria bacterium]|jgi:mannose-1-phosphate guanylyltransferase|nr:mannose-1-phosphate guanylyltransferase [Candidatus Falkowbacteria bacterium]MBT7348234.1 mannose-1-phosphate guanylyltransferase [Candidatus Falkowbacteria bacterium]MBT7500213.1 mannose-1-phosphate guanylyltransferase [Candidatus Falkowbacteria bacterium]
MKIVILAGGGGTRLWPLSRQNKPKQFSRLVGDKTLYETTIDRFRNDFDVNDIYVCLNDKLLSQAKSLVPDIPEQNYIIEPEKRDTAAAMGFVAAKLSIEFPDEPIAFIPSDHYISYTTKFIRMIKRADQLIRDTGKMLDIAVWPTFPSTVLGYTRIGKKVEANNGIEVYEFKGHVEKPEFEVAKEYLAAGDYLWHANYYMWTPRKILQAFEKYCPGHYLYLEQMVEAFKQNDLGKVNLAFSQMEKTSFDYAITEKIDVKDVLIIKGDFGWSDVGAFDVLHESQKSKSDKNGNVINGNYISQDSANCLIYSKSDKLIVGIEIEDLVVVDTEDVLMICPKGKAQKVKKVVEKLKENNMNKYL